MADSFRILDIWDIISVSQLDNLQSSNKIGIACLLYISKWWDIVAIKAVSDSSKDSDHSLWFSYTTGLQPSYWHWSFQILKDKKSYREEKKFQIMNSERKRWTVHELLAYVCTKDYNKFSHFSLLLNFHWISQMQDLQPTHIQHPSCRVTKFWFRNYQRKSKTKKKKTQEAHLSTTKINFSSDQ